ncbi:MAG: DUF1573 domain-containing protein [Chitinophagaceae bacterium]
MKKILLTLLVAAACVSVKAQTTPDGKPDVLQLKETGFDFGKIAQGRPVTHNFEITNTGATPLMLDNVQASCGCTTPEWSREAIKPGATATIKVGYNAAAEGVFNRSITIQYNNGMTKTMLISGTVLKAPATSAPVNGSISLLKQTN